VKTTLPWNAASFEDPTRKQKFLNLIGAKKKKKETYDPLAPTGDSPEREEVEVEQPQVDKMEQAVESFYAQTAFKQDEQFAELERQYETAIDRREKQATHGKFGLGAN